MLLCVFITVCLCEWHSTTGYAPTRLIFVASKT